MMLLCYIVGILLTFIIVSLVLKKEKIVVDDDILWFVTLVIVSLLFPMFWLMIIVDELAEKWIKWVTK